MIELQETEEENGRVIRIAGPVIMATGFQTTSKNVVVRIGPDQILGEVVQVKEAVLIIQSYEDTEGIKIGDEVVNTKLPLYATLGPGMLGTMYDGLQRPIDDLLNQQGPFLKRGTLVDPFDSSDVIHFIPLKKIGDEIGPGEIIGQVREKNIEHSIIASPSINKGKITTIVNEDDYRVDTELVTLDSGDHISFHHKWEIRTPRPVKSRTPSYEPLITGQRIIDSLFPVVKGGTSIVSGGFGTGKTILEQSLAKYTRVDIIVLVLIGERGNEVATLLSEFKELMDEDGVPLLDRTVTIANTSNMPVAAREASIYLGMTIAEYYRDIGYNVALLADSMSRWAEAVREISGRLEEMPVEEGYPPYMSKTLGEFFERAGSFSTYCDKQGSISYIAAISPPGGDFSEPVTQAALRVTGAFWALSNQLARSRHFPAIDWTDSFTLYGDMIASIISEQFPKWGRIRNRLLAILKQEEELEQSVRLLGRDSLSEAQKGILDIVKLVKNSFLQQNAFDPIDQDCSLEKQYLMLQVIDRMIDYMQSAVDAGMTTETFFAKSLITSIRRMRDIGEDNLQKFEEIISQLENAEV